MCDYVNDEENKNEILHVDNEIETEHAVSKKLIEVIEDLQVKIENLTRNVDSMKELLVLPPGLLVVKLRPLWVPVIGAMSLIVPGSGTLMRLKSRALTC
jgi:hypothetical protein